VGVPSRPCVSKGGGTQPRRWVLVGMTTTPNEPSPEPTVVPGGDPGPESTPDPEPGQDPGVPSAPEVDPAKN